MVETTRCYHSHGLCRLLSPSGKHILLMLSTTSHFRMRFEWTEWQQSLHHQLREFAMESQAAIDNVNGTVKFHGNLGNLIEHHVEHYYRDAKPLPIADGLNGRRKDTHAKAAVDQYGEYVTCL